MNYFATEYTIHFDDTMAYGSHHFLTAFKFQCAVRETYLFGDRIFDQPGVPEALNSVHLFTGDAYSRNLSPLILGDRVAILQTLEDWGRATVRFCYRVISEKGNPVCAGFQTMICADAKTGNPISVPEPLWDAMQSMREIEEVQPEISFRDRVLAGGSKLETVFGPREIATAKRFLQARYPQPGVIAAAEAPFPKALEAPNGNLNDDTGKEPTEKVVDVWLFAGQGMFDSNVLSERVTMFRERHGRDDLSECIAVASRLIGGDAEGVLSGNPEVCVAAIESRPLLSQVAIHCQNVLGALLMIDGGARPDFLVGHSLGEIAALGVSGRFDLPTGVEIVCHRVRAIEERAPIGGGLLLVIADRETCSNEATLLGLSRVVVAGRNHQNQTVLSGPVEQLSQLSEYFQRVGVTAIAISSPTSFHHPELREAASTWRRTFSQLSFRSPTYPVYSPIGRQVIEASDDIADVLSSQFVRPFDLSGAIEDLLDAGANRFIDCGSSGALAKLVAKTATAVRVRSAVLDCSKGFSETAISTNSSEEQALPETSSQVPSSQEMRPAIAIVGMGCALPGGASSPTQLLKAINQQRVGIVDQRSHDPNWEEDFYSEDLRPDRSTSFLCGRVDGEDFTCPLGVEPEVFNSFSRAQKLLCMALAPCVPALEGADRVMCLVGSTADGYEDQDIATSLQFAGIEPKSVDARLNSAKAASQTPYSAVQEVFDALIRPGLDVTLVDAACASSLYTVALGTQALEQDQTDAVLAGGVFCPGPGNSCLFSQFQGTTATGCRPFDSGADGVVFSEGAAFVTLRRLEDAHRLGFPISAIVRGVGLSSDGRSSSANVPQTSGQLLSLQRCYEQYQIDPASICAIEAHGTSTPVGDSTELRTLHRFFEHRASDPLPVHSLKGLLGHAGWAAGTASVIAVCEYMRSGAFPAQAFHQEPSQALLEAAGTLFVPTQPVDLPRDGRRIAVDGFGFGGANGHLVLEAYDNSGSRGYQSDVPLASCDDELVVVATETLRPEIGQRFDRQAGIEGHLILPDLVDDLDISQKLAVRITDQIVSQLPLKDADRDEISVVLALPGKSERGIEATMRVLAPRFRRSLAGMDAELEQLEKAVDSAAPSGPYTLQGMMPNVASGRAALQLDLHGPNFVVDAGENSLASARKAAALLLRSGQQSGIKIVVVATIHVGFDTDKNANDQEYAAAFAITTRSLALQRRMTVVSSINDAATFSDPLVTSKRHKLTGRHFDPENENRKQAIPPTAQPLNVAQSVNSEQSPKQTLFPIYSPTWVDAPLLENGEGPPPTPRSALVIVSSDYPQLEDLVRSVTALHDECLICLEGQNAEQIAMALNHDATFMFVDSRDSSSLAKASDLFSRYQPSVVLAVDHVSDWEPTATLTRLAEENSICELLFLAAQANIDRLERDELELWTILPGGWNGAAHPSSGRYAGILKAVARELCPRRACVVCTRDDSIGNALAYVVTERNSEQRELEVVFDKDRRLVRRLGPIIDESVTPMGDVVPSPVYLDENSVVVATGGARGVTSVLLESVSREYGCKIIALGRSELHPSPWGGSLDEVQSQFFEDYLQKNPSAAAPEMKQAYESASARWEAHQTIQRLSEHGLVEYISTDVTDPNSVANAINSIGDKYGKVDLLIHGAGVQRSKQLKDRTLQDFRMTYGVKVIGLHNLISACLKRFGNLVNVHVLTSAYSIFGNDGQHDYGAANETLDRLCELTCRETPYHWNSIAWLAWDGIGMTRGSEYKALAEQRDLSRLDASTGQDIFRTVLERSAESINVPLSESEHLRYDVSTVPAPVGRKGRIVELPVKLGEIECLPFHQVRHMPVLPGAWTIDRMVQGGLELAGDRSRFTLAIFEDVRFHRFVRYAWGYEPNMRVIAKETHGGMRVWMIGDVLMPNGEPNAKDVIFAQAKLRFETTYVEVGTRIRFDASHADLPGVADPYCSSEDSDVQLSGPFACLQEIKLGEEGRSARFTPSPVYRNGYAIPSLLLDAALRVGAMHASDDDVLCVPITIGRLVLPIGGPQDGDWDIRTTRPQVVEKDVQSFRTEAYDANGRLKLIIDNAIARQMQ